MITYLLDEEFASPLRDSSYSSSSGEVAILATVPSSPKKPPLKIIK